MKIASEGVDTRGALRGEEGGKGGVRHSGLEQPLIPGPRVSEAQKQVALESSADEQWQRAVWGNEP